MHSFAHKLCECNITGSEGKLLRMLSLIINTSQRKPQVAIKNYYGETSANVC